MQHCSVTLSTNRISIAQAKTAFRQLAGTRLRLTYLQGIRNHQRDIPSNPAGASRACCSLTSSAKTRANIENKANVLRRAVLGGILLSAGAMPFTPKRFASAAAADLPADKVQLTAVVPVGL